MVATNVAKLYSQRIFIYENIKNASLLIAGIIDVNLHKKVVYT